MPDITKTEYGTPLLDFVFRRAQDLARNDTMCYVNSDIILMNDLSTSLQEIKFDKFLVAGQRWDLDIKKPLDFGMTDWENRLRRIVTQYGSLHPPAGIDYFVFTRDCLGPLPPFAVGRVGWDNWFIYNSRARGVPVIDVTQRAMAVHQNHNYNHIPKRTGDRWEGPESIRNLELMGRKIYEWSLEDADWFLSGNGLLKKPLTSREICRKLTLATPADLHPILEALFRFQRRVRQT